MILGNRQLDFSDPQMNEQKAYNIKVKWQSSEARVNNEREHPWTDICNERLYLNG